MKTAIEGLAGILEQAPARLVDISDADAGRAPAGAWCAKQVIGHLIDSASNNHQRFVRALAAPDTAFPAYDQMAWVEAERWHERRWPDIVNLWLLYNRHLLHLLRSIPETKYGHLCTVGDKAPATIEELAVDYVGHMRRHLEQVYERARAAPAG